MGPGDIHVGHLLLNAVDDDLADAWHQHELLAQGVCGIEQVSPGIAVARHSDVDTVHIAEIIENDGVHGSGRQIGCGISHPSPELIEDVGKVLGPEFILEVDEDVRQSRPGNRHLDPFHLGQALDRVLQYIGHLVLHLRSRGAGIGGEDLGRLDSERRIFQLPHAVEGQQPAAHQHHHQQPGVDGVFDGVFADIHQASSSRGSACSVWRMRVTRIPSERYGAPTLTISSPP